MKKTFFTLAVAILTAGSIITGCQSTTEKKDNPPDQMQDSVNNDKTSQHLVPTMMHKDSISEYQAFKQNAGDRMIAFEATIAELKVKIADGKKETQAEYSKKLASLEKKNNDMKMELEVYQEDARDNWRQFKSEFNEELNVLNKALQDFMPDNKG